MPLTFGGGSWNSNIGLHGGLVDDLSGLASSAVAAKVAGLDMLLGSDQRVPVVAEVEGDWIAAGIGPLGEFWWGIHPDGSLEVQAMASGGAVTTQEDVDDLLWAPVVFSDNTYGEIHLDKDGKVQQWALGAWAQRMHVTSGSSGTTTVHVFIGMGQSNMSGRGVPISSEIDPPDPRILQYGAHATDITVATVPLDMVDDSPPAYGISPLTLIAREYLKRLPPGDVVLLIPAARGGSTLGATDTVSSTGVWNVAYTGPSVDLYSRAKTQITAALTAAAARWPSATIRKAGMFWHQGEGNPTTSQVDYASRFDAIVSDLRTLLSAPNMPVVLGGMVPEWVNTNPGLANVRAAHIDTPNRVVRTGYAYSPANGGGNLNLDSNNQVHFHREGLEVLSARMLTAWDRALRNVTTSVPNVPQTITATLNGTTLTVNWSQPMCRYTAFTVQYSANGSAWNTIPTSSVDTTAVTTITGTNPVQVRISVTNEYGTSVTSTPVYAIIIKEP